MAYYYLTSYEKAEEDWVPSYSPSDRCIGRRSRSVLVTCQDVGQCIKDSLPCAPHRADNRFGEQGALAPFCPAPPYLSPPNTHLFAWLLKHAFIGESYEAGPVVARMSRCWSLLVLLAVAVAGTREDKITYQGAQLLRINITSEEEQDIVRALEDSDALLGNAAASREDRRLCAAAALIIQPHTLVETLMSVHDVEAWNGLAANSTSVDVLVLPENKDKVKESLVSSNLTYDVLIQDMEAAIQEENPMPTDEEIAELEGRKGHRMTWQSYHRMQDVHGYLDWLAQSYPKLCSVQTIGSSVEGRPLKVLKISSDKAGSPAIWIDGGIHAREWISPATVTYIINELTENRHTHGDAVQNVDWYILPIVNPDGYEYTHRTDRLWRKNRSNGNSGGRCAGVDLNRNFAYKWGGAGSSHQPCKEIYAGSSGFSEPETSAVSNFVLSKKDKIKAYVTFHSYGQYILYPWGYDRVVPPDYKDLDRVARKAAQAMYKAGGSTYTVGSAATTLYAASGGSDDWAKGSAKIKYTYTIELRDRGYHGFVLPSNYIVPTANEGLAAIKVFAQELANALVVLSSTAEDGEIEEEVRVKEVQFHSERQQLQAELLLVKQGTSKDDREAFIEQLKDKDEMIVKLGLEIEVLKTKVRDLQESSDDLEVLVSFMKSEVERYKSLSTNNNSKRTGSLALKSSSILNQEVDRYRSEVERQDATIKTLNHDLELARDSLEAKKNELIAVVSESRLQLETLEMRLCDIQATLKKERMEAKKYALEKEEDKKTVKDLTRQVREMERILKRNHPNSISALILTANSDVEAGGTSPRVKYLENRIQQLEQELQTKETEAASSFQKIQDQFHSMKSKYEAHIADLELELAAAKHQANMRKLAAEKVEPTEARTQIVNNKDLQQPPSSKAPKKQPTYAPQTCHSTALSLNAISVKEDTHLIATIRGLHSEMSLKEREIHKLGKELEEAKRMVRKLQKDRDRLLDKDTNNLVKGTRTKASSKNDKPEPALEDKGLDVDSQSSLKPYDPVRFQFPQDGEEGISTLRQQNQILRRDLLQVEEEYRRLKTKRMQDLNLLQQQHELEMEQVVSEHMARHSGSRIAELQGQLGTQRMVIAQLKEQLKQLDEYREEIVVLKTERNLLEKSAIELNKKLTTLRSLQTPEALHYEALQDKIQELESRHEFREQKLQAVVKDLLRRNAEQRAHLAEREQNGNSVNLREKLMDKNRELCLYQAEMDRILDTLRSLYRCRGPNNFSE
uniref:Peptidase M14 domain-containing protein n=1 Tax=Timema monikensis TaxID=170555 RepID=A0A7R9E426_9NEOP|nr:unnamed protein product [Timema monikensis]